MRSTTSAQRLHQQEIKREVGGGEPQLLRFHCVVHNDVGTVNGLSSDFRLGGDEEALQLFIVIWLVCAY